MPVTKQLTIKKSGSTSPASALPRVEPLPDQPQFQAYLKALATAGLRVLREG